MHLLLLLVWIPLLAGSPVGARECKCLPSDPSWPSLDKWLSLNETVSGRLIRTVPLASVCYPTEPNYDTKACESVVSNWTSSAFHAADPASAGDLTWTDSSCLPLYPNGTSIGGDPDARKKGCSIGNFPPYVVNATEFGHIQAALMFAKKYNIRFNIKNTGHNPEKSLARGSLSVWTHNLKQIQFHENYQPKSCGRNETHMAATIGAGVQDRELFKAMAEHKSIAVGGTNMDVGFIGWATGGGHGLMTGKYGQGADNILEAVIVTPTGDVLTANECQNEDIFWAIRGGGGGTFGVIVSATVKAYPIPSMELAGFDITAKNSTTSKDWWRFVARVHHVLPELQDSGVHGYYTMGGPPMALSGSFLLFDERNGTISHRLKTFKEVLDKGKNLIDYNISSNWVPSWWDLAQHMPAIENIGTERSIRSSRFIPRRAVLTDLDLLAGTLEKIGPKAVVKANGISNPSLSGTMTASKMPVDNALNPAWRDSVVHIITTQSWDDTLPQDIAHRTIEEMTYDKGYALRQLAPDSGAYYNEANPYEVDWQWSFWGQNYPRLHAIKQKYDPDGILWCRHCVGSEAWAEQDDGALCRAYLMRYHPSEIFYVVCSMTHR